MSSTLLADGKHGSGVGEDEIFTRLISANIQSAGRIFVPFCFILFHISLKVGHRKIKTCVR